MFRPIEENVIDAEGEALARRSAHGGPDDRWRNRTEAKVPHVRCETNKLPSYLDVLKRCQAGVRHMRYGAPCKAWGGVRGGFLSFLGGVPIRYVS